MNHKIIKIWKIIRPYSNPKYPLIGLYKNWRDTTEPYGIQEYRRLKELF